MKIRVLEDMSSLRNFFIGNRVKLIIISFAFFILFACDNDGNSINKGESGLIDKIPNSGGGHTDPNNPNGGGETPGETVTPERVVIPSDFNIANNSLLDDIFRPYLEGSDVVKLYISPEGSGKKDGSSWDNALQGDGDVNSPIHQDKSRLKYIIEDIDATSNKYLLILSGGKYRTYNPISMKSNVAITGGWKKNSAGEIEQDASVITKLVKSSGSNSIIENNRVPIDRTALLYGVTIDGMSRGLGMRNVGPDVSPTIAKVTFSEFKNNNSLIRGAAVFNSAAAPVFIDVTFSNNYSAGQGAAMYNLSSSPVLLRVSFINNRSDSGAMMHNSASDNALHESAPILIQAVFYNNSGNSVGAIYNENSSPTLDQVTFYKNKSTGGGVNDIYIDDAPEIVSITNSIFWGETDTSKLIGVGKLNENINIYNSVFRGEIPTVTKIDDKAPEVVTGNIIKTNPLLSDSLFSGNNLIQVVPIGAGSSAIDKGLYVVVKDLGVKTTSLVASCPAGKSNCPMTTYKTLFYYSDNNTDWYSEHSFTTTGLQDKIHPSIMDGAISSTEQDATGYERVGVPDIGAYEYR